MFITIDNLEMTSTSSITKCIAAVVIMTLALTACNRTADKSPAAPGGNVDRSRVPANASLELTPANPARSDILCVVPQGFDLTKTSLQWSVNGSELPGVDGVRMKARDLARGDNVQVKAVAGGREILSNVVTIANTPPEIKIVKILPDVFKPGDRLQVDVVAADIDGDDVSLSYAWSKNGEPAGAGSSIDGSVGRGDVFIVTVTPFDGTDYGKPMVVRREIRNLPPVIEEHSNFQFQGSLYTYQVRASDPDGDTLSYSLESPPPGMAIDPVSGLLTWKVPREYKGKQSASVVVNDGNGGIARYSLQITIQ